MQKVILGIFIFGVMVLLITGCDRTTKKELKDIHSFEGTIIECEQESMIVRPDKSEEEYRSSDKFRISYVGDFNSCHVDDKVKITYEGMINTSYPAQVGTTKIEIVSDK